MPPKERKTDVLSIRFTADEFDRMLRAAKREKLEIRDWGRKHLLSLSP